MNKVTYNLDKRLTDGILVLKMHKEKPLTTKPGCCTVYNTRIMKLYKDCIIYPIEQIKEPKTTQL